MVDLPDLGAARLEAMINHIEPNVSEPDWSFHMAPFAGGCRSRIPPFGGAMLMLLRPPC
ncbi:hypothetical protein MPL3356_110353 [Mesorhizobium plurifarium]|uniref:Uncharacterized protein n=1 Tax=Mesorhizobium plurifarium TaxID=69974 RepID=A0A090DAG9_MESPL|nr:hypothetical protein MPL3356_110353 [Mesorhizobium plurifarium]